MSEIGGFQFPMALDGSSIATAYDADLVASHLQFLLESYLPTSFEVFSSLENLVLLEEDLRLAVVAYMPDEGEYRVKAIREAEKVTVNLYWKWRGDEGQISSVILT